MKKDRINFEELTTRIGAPDDDAKNHEDDSQKRGK